MIITFEQSIPAFLNYLHAYIAEMQFSPTKFSNKKGTLRKEERMEKNHIYLRQFHSVHTITSDKTRQKEMIDW